MLLSDQGAVTSTLPRHHFVGLHDEDVTLVIILLLFPGPAAGSVTNVQNDQFVTLDRVKDRISEPPDVPTANTGHFRSLRQVRIIGKESERVIDAVCKISSKPRSAFPKIGDNLRKLRRGWLGIPYLHVREERA